MPPQDDDRRNGYALQCRITTEDPENHFIPDYGRISAYRGATGFGIRLDGGTAYSGGGHHALLRLAAGEGDRLGARATTSASRGWTGRCASSASAGVKTNLPFLEALITHPPFRAGDYTTRFVDETPELFRFRPRRDRATRLLSFVGDVLVNGNPEVRGPRRCPPTCRLPDPRGAAAARGARRDRDRLRELGAEGFAAWMRDAGAPAGDRHHLPRRPPVAARHPLPHARPAGPAPRYYARHLPGLLLARGLGRGDLRRGDAVPEGGPVGPPGPAARAVPNVLLQMLLRASNAVGYTNYPDNVVRYFVAQAADAGIDLFRVFDSLNWVENMRVAMDAVLESGMLCEAAICYTGDLTDPSRDKYDLAYYVDMAQELEAAGAHVLGIKDMAGLCKPEAARMLVTALREEVGLPIHFHTHDTAGAAAASVLAAVGGRRGRRRRGDGPDERPHLAAEPRTGGRGPARHARATPASTREPLAGVATTGRPCARLRGLRERHARAAPPRSTSTRCPAASTPTCASRRGRSASSRAGARWRRPTPRSTGCSATSSRSRPPRRWSATWRSSW